MTLVLRKSKCLKTNGKYVYHIFAQHLYVCPNSTLQRYVGAYITRMYAGTYMYQVTKNFALSLSIKYEIVSCYLWDQI